MKVYFSFIIYSVVLHILLILEIKPVPEKRKRGRPKLPVKVNIYISLLQIYRVILSRGLWRTEKGIDLWCN